MGKGIFRGAVAVLGLALFLAAAAPASADTEIAVLGDTLFISAEGQNNSMEFKVVNQKYRTVDSGSILVPGAGCVREPPADATTVDCTGNIFKAIVGMGDGKDDFTPANYIQLELTESGEGGNDQLTGGLGDDTIRGNAGDDYLDGGSFAAVPDAGSGADVLEGGAGLDTADYSKRTVPLVLTEGDGANDGQDTGAGPGSEGDNLVSAETILGGSAGDLIAGADGDNTLSGGAGNDALRGAGGADILRGGNGDDWLDGGTGPDLLQGGHGTDTASYAQRSDPVSISLDSAANDGAPGEGDNVDQGTENVEGGSGDDTILTADGVTGKVTCGAGTDTVRADAFDTVAADCETVSRSALPDPGASALAAIGLPKRLKVRHGVAHLRVTCPPSALGGCAKGRLSALSGGKTLAKAEFTVAAGESVTVTLKFGRKARAKLAKVRKVTLAVSAVGVAPATERVALR